MTRKVGRDGRGIKQPCPLAVCLRLYPVLGISYAMKYFYNLILAVWCKSDADWKHSYVHTCGKSAALDIGPAVAF